MSADAHNVGEVRFLLIPTGRICALFATMITVAVFPAVLWGAWGLRLGTPTASTGAASASVSTAAAVVVVAYMVGSVGEL